MTVSHFAFAFAPQIATVVETRGWMIRAKVLGRMQGRAGYREMLDDLTYTCVLRAKAVWVVVCIRSPSWPSALLWRNLLYFIFPVSQQHFPNTMPKNTQNSASRGSLRRNQVNSRISLLCRHAYLCCPLQGLSHLPQKKAGIVPISLYSLQHSDLFHVRDVMPHVLTVLHASSTRSRCPLLIRP